MARDIQKHKEWEHNWYLRNKDKVRKRTRVWRKKNKEKRREYEKKYRLKYPEKVKEQGRKYRLNNKEKVELHRKLWRKKNPLKRKIQDERYRKRYPEKFEAQMKLNGAIRYGKIKRKPCVICRNKKSQGHHPDYLKPLEVIWLCQKHHYLKHLEFRNVAEKKC